MADEMKYEVHLQNGEVWFCQDLGYVKDMLDSTRVAIPQWVDEEIDMVMTGAIQKKYLHCDEKPADVVYLTYTPVAVKVIEKTVVSQWHLGQQGKLSKFP